VYPEEEYSISPAKLHGIISQTTVISNVAKKRQLIEIKWYGKR
jgi:hypothetical protein